MGVFVGHTSCDNCGSSDGKALYKDGSSYCWVCQHTVPSQEYLDSLEDKPKGKGSKVKVKVKEKNDMDKDEDIQPSKPSITQEEREAVKASTQIAANGFRGVTDETYKTFGVRHAVDEAGNVLEQYYPCTADGELTGYKIREVPKNFRSIARTGSDCDLFMQFKFNRGGKYLLLTEGEVDSLSSYQMLKDYNKSKGNDFETAVVSATVGANAIKQYKRNYKFLDTFEQIILCFDNDAAGKAAAEKLVSYLPKGKVKIMQMRFKDPNEYLMKGEQKAFITDFYNAKTYVPVGVLGSSEIYDRILEQTATAKVPFPPFMRRLNEMMIGGVPLGHIVNIAAGTGLGKTSFVNEMIYYWVFNSPHKIGVVSMELDAGQYGETLLSRHLSKKLSLIKDEGEKTDYLTTEFVKAKADELFFNEHGQDRFFLLDNRDGTVEEIQDKIEELVVSCDCKLIVVDPLSDILDGCSNEEQALFMKWAKGLIKSHGVTLIMINHVRKSSGNNAESSKGASYSEEEIQGSSTIIKSASFNILLSRNKYAEDEQERNTTKVVLSKNRVCGITGPAGGVYYDNATHTLHNLDDYLNGNV